ncbi:S-adenosylmethionine-dependent methyltransferase SCDLUD_001782 [Saccharomycodes ludwigii]|uniref:S-adenosylmethionine-dependent methyltransferase n=1 Tax=Saccharomycodes ludwigii TaxID=36035 RepID=UPI001E866DCC|nr:hypothetical protein SCDLUD_001782 [Saccharomycodes ludwigii]KAH3901994.1 hypothetical protein SCDLUD_001782 [Saccharomycodes ludwigii]
MLVSLLHLDSQDTIYEHIFERYIELENNSNYLKQDLGIQNRSLELIEIDIDPPPENYSSNNNNNNQKRNKGKKSKSVKTRENNNYQNKCINDSYHLSINQSLCSLNSTQNNNSTTGFVLWQSSPLFIKWLLYQESASFFRNGHTSSDSKDTILPLCDESTILLELGCGISGILPIILSNYVCTYIATDQNSILNKLKKNILSNINEINKREVISKTLGITKSQDEEFENYKQSKNDNHNTKKEVVLEICPLDWEHPMSPATDLFLNTLITSPLKQNNNLLILAMDVIYNTYLIEPFLSTIDTIFQKYSKKNFFSGKVQCFVGIQLRTQDVVEEFLIKAVEKHQFMVKFIDDPMFLNKSRFAYYLIEV